MASIPVVKAIFEPQCGIHRRPLRQTQGLHPTAQLAIGTILMLYCSHTHGGPLACQSGCVAWPLLDKSPPQSATTLTRPGQEAYVTLAGPNFALRGDPPAKGVDALRVRARP